MSVFKQFREQLIFIRSFETETIQKGRLLQFLIALITVAFFSQTLLVVYGRITPLAPNWLASPLLWWTPLLLTYPVCWWLIRNARMRRASHLFVIVTTLLLIIMLIAQPNQGISYLLLVGVVAMSMLDSVRVSAVYAGLTIIIVATVMTLSTAYDLIDIINYLTTTIGLCITVWVAALNLTGLLAESRDLATDIQQKNNQLSRSARQLQLSTEIAQATSQSLDLNTLLYAAAYQIMERFGYYYVSIFLLDEPANSLVLAEATGPIGETLKKRPFIISLADNSIVGWAAVNKTARISTEVEADPLYKNEPLLHETKSELSLPLVARGSVVGVLDVQSRATNAFLEEDITILQLMANQIAVNIDNAQLFIQTEQRLNETRALYQLTRKLTTTFDVGEIYRRSAQEFAIQLNGHECNIYNWEPADQLFYTQAIYQHNSEDGTGQFSPAFKSITPAEWPTGDTLLQSSEPTFRLDTTVASDIDPQLASGSEEEHHTLEIALTQSEETTGIIQIHRQGKPFSSEEVELAQAMGNQTTLALRNAQLTSNARGQLAQFSSLLRLSNILAKAPTLTDVFTGVRREVMSLIEATGIGIMLVADDETHLRWAYGYEYGKEIDLSNLPLQPISVGFSGYVVRNREMLMVEKSEENIRKYNSFSIGGETGFWLGLPMLVASQIIGVFAIENDRAFNPKEIELLETITGPLAISINNLIQFEEIETALAVQSRQRLQLKVAAEVAAAAASVTPVDKLMSTAVNLIKERFALYYVGLFLVNNQSNYAVLQVGTGVAGEIQVKAGHQLQVGGKSLIGGATSDTIPRIIQDVRQNQEWRPNPHLPDTRSELALPLRVRKATIGALTVQSTKPNVFDADLVDTLLTMADQLAIAIDNARLLEEAQKRAADQQALNDISSQMRQATRIDKIAEMGLRTISNRISGSPVKLRLGRTPENQQDGDEA